MGNLYLYSTNPKYAHDFAVRYLAGKHYVWCSEEYSPIGAPSSNPREIYRTLESHCDEEDSHSHLIHGYKKTFRRLALDLFDSDVITEEDKEDIIAIINSSSWNIWRPQLYIINRTSIESSGRLIEVPPSERAAYGLEWRIHDLDVSEFEIIER